MSDKHVTIRENVERRTFLRGKFEGKFIGYLDEENSDRAHEKFYSIEVLSGEIVTESSRISKWANGESSEFQHVDKFLTALPETLQCTINDGSEHCEYYNIHLHEPKLVNYTLSNQVYDGLHVLGDIKGDISGFLQHFDEVETVIDKVEEKKVRSKRKTKTKTLTGRFEERGSYRRDEYYYSDKSTYWGSWKFQPNPQKTKPNSIAGVFRLLIWLLILIPLIIAGWSALWPLLAVLVFYFLLGTLPHLLSFLGRWFLHLGAAAFVILFLFDIVSIVRDGRLGDARETRRRVDRSHDAIDPPEPKRDSIIRHTRNWTDYDGKQFMGTIAIRRKDLNAAADFRNNLQLDPRARSAYDELVTRIRDFDQGRLRLVYKMLDSLQEANRLDRIDFAKVVVSCVQDIPYTLILDNECDPALYNDKFIVDYLNDERGPCRGQARFGLLTPVEFLASMDGDCDTRVLLLFVVLAHYNYDVVMLGSELYSHSVLGIDLPISGASKIIGGRRYVIWETTQPQQPGIFPRELSEMRFWDVNMTSNDQSI